MSKNKPPSSATGPLSRHVFGQMFSMAMLLLFVLSISGLIFLFQRVENGMLSAVQAQDSLPAFGYRIPVRAAPAGGFTLPLPNDVTALKAYPEVTRRIVSSAVGEGDRFWSEVGALRYEVTFPTEKVTIVYDLGADLQTGLRILLILAIAALVALLASIGENRRAAWKAVAPLVEQAERAKQLDVPMLAPTEAELARVRKLADVVSRIDVSTLDRRVTVDGTGHEEIAELSRAINGMLASIGGAYRSQVRFVSDASHELRTPIAVIQGYANLLDRWGKNDEKTTQEAIDAIKAEAQSMKELVEQLLFLARGDNETMQLAPEPFDAGAMVEEILRETQMIDVSHTFRADVSGTTPILADRSLLKQAVRILVDNSIQYTPTGGEILLAVRAEDGTVRIRVQDEGLGIASEDLPHIFDRFYRSDESRARRTGGSGLGLAIMKWIVDRHKGYVEVVSRQGIGTRTTLVLPLATAAESAAQTAPSE